MPYICNEPSCRARVALLLLLLFCRHGGFFVIFVRVPRVCVCAVDAINYRSVIPHSKKWKAMEKKKKRRRRNKQAGKSLHGSLLWKVYCVASVTLTVVAAVVVVLYHNNNNTRTVCICLSLSLQFPCSDRFFLPVVVFSDIP